MKNLEIHHVLNGKTVVTKLFGVADEEAEGAVKSLARLRANDGVLTGTNFAIPARSVEMIKTVNIR